MIRKTLKERKFLISCMMMSYQKPATSPNIEKLFNYLWKSLWHNVSSNFSGFVRREFESNMEKLEEDRETYHNLKLMIEYSEMGRFSEAKAIADPAYKEFNVMLEKLHARRSINGPSPRQKFDYSPRNEATNRPMGNNDFSSARVPASPMRRSEMAQEGREDPSTNRCRPSSEHDHRSPNQYPAPEKPSNYYPQPSQSKFEPSSGQSPGDRGSRPGSNRPEQRSPVVMTSASQMASSKALWGREHGDNPSEKISSSTYRKDFPSYPVDKHERKDKEMYRDNFGSTTERDRVTQRDEVPTQRDEQRRSAQQRNQESFENDLRQGQQRHAESTEQDQRPGHQRHLESSEYDIRPSEIARRFKELFNREWQDAYDEISKYFGSEKAIKHLLWIVTEASLIVNVIADVQLHDLGKLAFDVMINPGSDQRGGYIPRQIGDALPSSRSLLLQYRKQTALLSIPYMKEECRDKISRILIDSCGFPQAFLSDNSRLTAYIKKCAELVWLMCVQDPPIVMQYITREAEGGQFNHDHYNIFTRSGKVYDFGVWPMLRLGRNGDILLKGVAQGI